MKILQISNYYKPHIGGIEQVAHDISDSLSNNYEQKVICFSEDKYDKVEIVDGVEVFKCGYFIKISSQALSLSYGKTLKKVMDEFEPDVVIFHYPNPFVAHYLLKNLKDKQTKLLIYWHLDITKQKILGKLFHYQNIKLIKKANVVIGATPNHIYDSKYYEYFKNKSKILPYAIDEKRLSISNEEQNNSIKIRDKYSNKIICFFIGRHVPYKGLEYLIKASALLDDKYVFLIAGKGQLTDELKEKSTNDKKIVFLGKISDSDWRSYLNACDIFCFPSITRNEAFGLALAEAMYYKKPAVTFHIDGSGVNFVNLDRVTGLEAPNMDFKELANNIKKLGENKDLRFELGNNGYKRVIENFTFHKFKNNLEQLLEEIKQ